MEFNLTVRNKIREIARANGASITDIIKAVKAFNNTNINKIVYADGVPVFALNNENKKCFFDTSYNCYFLCAECGKVHPATNVAIIGGAYYCKACRERLFVKCAECGEWFKLSDLTYIENYDRYVCRNCLDTRYVECAECGEWVNYNDTYTIYDGSEICEACRYDSGEYEECSDCEEIFPVHMLNSNGLCERCRHDTHALRGYHDGKGDGDYNLTHLNPNTNHCKLGVELEIDGGGQSSSSAEEILDTIGREYAICSTDSSLNDGFEIVSCPADITAHLNIIPWCETMEKALDLGYVSHNSGTCGLHVHVDREYFYNGIDGAKTFLTEEKFATVFGNNWEWLAAFSRRKNWGYCEITSTMKEKTTFRDIERAQMSKAAKPCGHYVAMNYHNNNTIEFRLFRGTLNYNTFVATLQLVDLFCILVKKRTLSGCTEIRLQTFKNLARIYKYNAFLNYITDRNITQNNQTCKNLEVNA